MHMLAIVLVSPDADVEAEVQRIMAPFDEALETRTDDDGYVPRTAFWDWYGIGGRWNGTLLDKELPIEYEHTVADNVVPVRDLSERKFYRLVCPDGRTVARQGYHGPFDEHGWPEYTDNPDFERLAFTWLIEHRDHLAVAVDYHC